MWILIRIVASHVPSGRGFDGVVIMCRILALQISMNVTPTSVCMVAVKMESTPSPVPAKLVGLELSAMKVVLLLLWNMV